MDGHAPAPRSAADVSKRAVTCVALIRLRIGYPDARPRPVDAELVHLSRMLVEPLAQTVWIGRAKTEEDLELTLRQSLLAALQMIAHQE